MPRLGEAVEPARTEHVIPWWRSVEAKDAEPRHRHAEPDAVTLPKSMPWPID